MGTYHGKDLDLNSIPTSIVQCMKEQSHEYVAHYRDQKEQESTVKYKKQVYLSVMKSLISHELQQPISAWVFLN